MSRRSFARVAVALAASALLVAFAGFAAEPEEKRKAEGAAGRPPEPQEKHEKRTDRQTAVYIGEAKSRAAIDKLIDAFDLEPKPLSPIPDKPPPHEGALIDMPYVVEPPDLILVEVLEALPGRPISGERLVRPDGKISLGFYGEVHVRGLTLPQVKVAIIKQIRNYIADDMLGLKTADYEESEPALPLQDRKMLPIPELPENRNPFDEPAEGRAPPAPKKAPGAILGGPTFRAASFATIPRTEPIHFVNGRGAAQAPEAKEEKAPEKVQGPILIPLTGHGQVKISVEIQGQNPPIAFPDAAGAQTPPFPPAMDNEETWRVIHPEDSDRVFVDVTAYNSKNYFVLGDVYKPGRLPWTGNETVLDAIQFVGGLLPSADPLDIILVRPGCKGGRTRVYPVHLVDIRDRGDVATNYQLFPGDRLVIGPPRGVLRQARLGEGVGRSRPASWPEPRRTRAATSRRRDPGGRIR